VLLGAAATALMPRLVLAATSGGGRGDALETALREDGLATHAARLGILFGTSVNPGTLSADPAYAALIKRECAVLVPESVLKADHTRAVSSGFDFKEADVVAKFARDNGMAFRGHALVWYRAVPAWVPATLSTRDDVRAEMLREVVEPCRHFRGRVDSWDVVNEAILPSDGLPSGLRRSFWREKLGDGYIATAFAAARAADPSATLVLNEYGIEADAPAHEQKRRALLGLLTSLRRDGVPVDALGIQAHLIAGAPFDPERFGRFLDGVRELGLKILITEMDVSDERLPLDTALRDDAVAKTIDEFLPVVLRHGGVTTVVAWGMSDRHSWMGKYDWGRRKDGAAPRPTLFDDELLKKPAYAAVRGAFDAAKTAAVPARSEANHGG